MTEELSKRLSEIEDVHRIARDQIGNQRHGAIPILVRDIVPWLIETIQVLDARLEDRRKTLSARKVAEMRADELEGEEG